MAVFIRRHLMGALQCRSGPVALDASQFSAVLVLVQVSLIGTSDEDQRLKMGSCILVAVCTCHHEHVFLGGFLLKASSLPVKRTFTNSTLLNTNFSY